LDLRGSPHAQAAREPLEAQRRAVQQWTQLHQARVIDSYVDNGVNGAKPFEDHQTSDEGCPRSDKNRMRRDRRLATGLLPIGQPVLHVGPLVVLNGFGGHTVEQGGGRELSKGIPHAAVSTSSGLYTV
jgi:hypothetical protein